MQAPAHVASVYDAERPKYPAPHATSVLLTLPCGHQNPADVHSTGAPMVAHAYPAGQILPVSLIDPAGQYLPSIAAHDPAHAEVVYVTAPLPEPKKPTLHCADDALATDEP